MRIVPDGDGVAFVMQSGDSPELYGIVTQHMPHWADLFARKNADYGDGAKVLGVRGQYADINRKMLKLKRSLWDGETLEFENSEEVIMDLIGHLFLTLYMLNFREETERARLFGSLSDAEFVDKFIDELGGPQQALRVSGLLTEALSAQITARCHERASERVGEGFYEPDADAPVDPDDAEHSAREAVRRFDREVATPAVLRGISIDEYEAMQQEALAKRLQRGADKQIAFMAMEASDGFHREEFADSDARQHGVGKTNVGPERIVAEQVNGVTRYYHEAYPGSDREPLVLVPSSLIGRLEKDTYVLTEEQRANARQIAAWTERY